MNRAALSIGHHSPPFLRECSTPLEQCFQTASDRKGAYGFFAIIHCFVCLKRSSDSTVFKPIRRRSPWIRFEPTRLRPVPRTSRVFRYGGDDGTFSRTTAVMSNNYICLNYETLLYAGTGGKKQSNRREFESRIRMRIDPAT